MKKYLAMVLALALGLSMAACGGNTDSSTTASKESTSAEATTENKSSEEVTTTTEEETTTEEAATSIEADTTASEEASSEEASGKVMSHAEYMAAAIDDEVTVECYVQAHQAWWEDKVTVYAADKDGAYFLYELKCPEADIEKLGPGAKIRVKGYKAEWSGEIEIADGEFEVVEGDPYIVEAKDVTDLLGKDELAEHQNEFVSFKGMTVEASKDADGKEVPFLYNWDGSGEQGNDLYFNVSVNGNTYNFCVESYLCDKDTDVYKAVEALQIGDKIDLEGFLYWYNGVNPHITSVTAAE